MYYVVHVFDLQILHETFFERTLIFDAKYSMLIRTNEAVEQCACGDTNSQVALVRELYAFSAYVRRAMASSFPFIC